MKNIVLFCLLPVFCGWLTAAPVAHTLVLKDSAAVSDNIVRIKDIALMDASTLDRIGNLVIAPAPDLGKTDTILKREIYEKLVGNGFESPKINGADSVKITRNGTTLPPSYFKDMILEYIVKNSQWKEGIQVEIASSKDIVIPQADVNNIRWQFMPANGQDFLGNILFKLQAFSRTSNEEIYSNWLVAKLKIIKSVPISNREIRKNQAINESDIRWEEREINAFNKDAVLEKDKLFGEKAGHMIRPNTVITADLLEKKYLVRRGDTVLLVAQSNSIKATSTVKVLADAGYGDSVQVMNISSQKILSAVVTGKNQVEVTVQ